MYQENKVITLPEEFPGMAGPGRGEVYVYGTEHPYQNESLFEVHKSWNKNSTGGDRRGRLLGNWTFDDGRCYSANFGSVSRYRQQEYYKTGHVIPKGEDLLCQIDIRLPTDIVGETYTLYWIWDWPAAETTKAKSKVITSCMDIVLFNGIVQGEVSYRKDQDPYSAAIEAQMKAA